MLQTMKAKDVMVEFLNNVTEFFPQYFNETFEAIWLKNNGYATNADQSPKVTPDSILCDIAFEVFSNRCPIWFIFFSVI